MAPLVRSPFHRTPRGPEALEPPYRVAVVSVQPAAVNSVIGALEAFGHECTSFRGTTIDPSEDFADYDIIVLPHAPTGEANAAHLRSVIDAGKPAVIGPSPSGHRVGTSRPHLATYMNLTGDVFSESAQLHAGEIVAPHTIVSPVESGEWLTWVGSQNGYVVAPGEPFVGQQVAEYVLQPSDGMGTVTTGANLIVVPEGTPDLSGVPVGANVVVWNDLRPTYTDLSALGVLSLHRMLCWCLHYNPDAKPPFVDTFGFGSVLHGHPPDVGPSSWRADSDFGIADGAAVAQTSTYDNFATIDTGVQGAVDVGVTMERPGNERWGGVMFGGFSTGTSRPPTTLWVEVDRTSYWLIANRNGSRTTIYEATGRPPTQAERMRIVGNSGGVGIVVDGEVVMHMGATTFDYYFPDVPMSDFLGPVVGFQAGEPGTYRWRDLRVS